MAASPHDSTYHAPSSDPHAPPSQHEIDYIKHHIKQYIYVFIALLVLTVVTVAVAWLPFSAVGHIVVALIIASIKAGLVALFFMHLISEKKLVVQVVLGSMLCAMFLFWLTWLAWYNPIIWGHDPYKPQIHAAPHH